MKKTPKKPPAADPLGDLAISTPEPDDSDGTLAALGLSNPFGGTEGHLDFSALGIHLDADDGDGDEEDEREIGARSESTKTVVSETIAQRRAREKAVLDRLDMGFFFSVVFATRAERDQWLAAHGLKLRGDDYVTADDLARLMR